MPSPKRFAVFALSLTLALSSFAQPAEKTTWSPTFAADPSIGFEESSSRTNLALLDAPGGAGGGYAVDGASHAPIIMAAGEDSWFFKKFAFGATISPLGVAVGSAASLTRSLNLRVQGHFFNYSSTESLSGVNFNASLSFRSISGQIDWFPFERSTFHVSPGVLFYNQNHLSGNGVVTVNESITFNDTDYYSDSTDPIRGTGEVVFRKTSPLLTVGWGNWVPRRREKHLTFPIDLGFAYVGDPAIKLNMTGSACQGPNDYECGNVNSDPSFQQNLNAQIVKYRQDLNVVRFYPVISTGIVYKF